MYKILLISTWFIFFVAAGQTGTIRGVVKKEGDRSPVLAATVLLKGTDYISKTSEDGSFELKDVRPGSYSLVVFFDSLKAGSASEILVLVKAGEVSDIGELLLKEKVKEMDEFIIRGKKQKVSRQSDQVAKINLSDLENPQVYSVVNKTTLEAQQANNMEDAMKNATGVSVVFPATGRATDGGTYYTSRGFTTSASLTNGIAGAVYSNPDAENIEQVIILKGPSATLYGGSLTSFGGAINTITKKPYDSLGGKITLTTGSWGLNRYAVDVNTPVNKNRTLLFRLTGAYHYQNSFQDYGFTKRFSVAPVISYKASDKLSFVLETNFSNIQATLPQWYYADSATTGVTSADQLSIDPMKYYFPGDLFATTKTANSMASMVYKLNDRWKSQTIFSSSYNQSTGPLTYLWFISDTSLTRNHQSLEGGNTQMNVQQNFSGDFTTGKLRHRVLAGADYYQNAANSTYRFFSGINDTVYTNRPNPNYMDYSKDALAQSPFTYYFGSYTGIQKIQRVGIYASEVMSVSDRLHVNAALRYDHFTSDGYSDPTLDTMIGAYKQGGFSPKLGAVYQVVKNNISLFANYQNSFQNVNGRDFNGKQFVPQQANQYEGGAKFSFLQDKLYGMLSYYNITVTNTLRNDSEHPTFSIQDGTQRSEGMEVELSTADLNGFSITTGYGYNNNRYITANEDVEGRRPVESGAAHLAHAWLNYEVKSGVVKGLGLGFGGNYSSKKFTNNDTFYGVFYNPAYLVFNSGLYYNQPKYRLALNANNLTDQRYWVGWNSSVLQKPREILVSAAWKF